MAFPLPLQWSSERRTQEEASVIRFLNSMYLPEKQSDSATAPPLKDRLLY
eukprot:m.608253 g.608253  ORF g.608253 m.608253 type:complete len:50 (+) comp22484_c2_seq18:2967-3116(+)